MYIYPQVALVTLPINKTPAIPKKATNKLTKPHDKDPLMVEVNSNGKPLAGDDIKAVETNKRLKSHAKKVPALAETITAPDEPEEKKMKMNKTTVKLLKLQKEKLPLVETLSDPEEPIDKKLNIVKRSKSQEEKEKVALTETVAVSKGPVIKDVSSAVKTPHNKAVIVVSIEHCKSCHRFGLKANEMFKEISEMLPSSSNVSVELALNEQTPRRGAFEVSIYPKGIADQKMEIWTGLKKGPPRKNKYPETSKVVEDILNYSKKL